MPQVFGEDGVRLMCWSHVFRNIRPKLAAIRKANAALGASMLADIESIQWMAQSEAEFELVCEKFKSHYLEQDLGEVERKLVTDFVEYFLSQWGPGSHAAGWYAGAHPFSLTNNQVCCQFFQMFFKCAFFYSTCSGIGGNTQGSQEEPHISNRAAIGPAHPDAGAAGNLIS